MRRLALACALLVWGCSELGFTGTRGQVTTRQGLAESCSRNLDCAYGLECVEGAARADGGTPAPGKTCQYKSFGDCEGESVNTSGLDGGSTDVSTISGQQQCLSGQRCRDGHCTVQCAGKADCREGEACKIGVCQRGGNKNAQCYDNRDCPWPETCFYGQCATRQETQRCQTDLDCGVGFRCINGRCQ